MRKHLATLIDDFRRFDRDVAVVRFQGNRRRIATYGEIARWAGRFAALLAARGVGPGDRVMLWGENSAEWIASFCGIILRGAMAVPLDAYGSAEFAVRVAADVKPKLVIGDALLLAKLTGSRISESASGPSEPPPSEVFKLAFEDWATTLPASEIGPVEGLNHDTPLQILFTSGTTGEPKGIVHTHGNVLASVGPIEKAAQGYMRYEKFVHPLRFLHTLPLSHVFGQTMGLWVPAIFAAEVHFENRLVAPRLIETIHRERISVLAAVPRVMALLKSHLESTIPNLAQRVTDSKNMKALKRWWVFRQVHRMLGLKFWALVSGGGALPGPLEQFWNTLGFVVVQGYGMTETTALITLNHPFHVASGTIGKPLPGREVKIGADGEVLVRGPMISTATWRGGQLRMREDEWLATGDIAEAQPTGELRFLGRKSEVIVTAAGVNIHPEDLEAAIEREPGISGCAVVPVQTASGPEPFAVVAARAGEPQAADAIEHANQHLADFQRVRRWALWPEPDLPRTSTGKVMRKAVSTWASGQQDGAGGQGNTAGDWLVTLLGEITGETPPGTEDRLRLDEDFHLDSLGRVQLAAALEERLGAAPEEGAIDRAQTLCDLRAIVRSQGTREPDNGGRGDQESEIGTHATDFESRVVDASTAPVRPQAGAPVAGELPIAVREISAVSPGVATSQNYLYPHWPWWKSVAWLRNAFLEFVAQPLTWFLADPKVVGRSSTLQSAEPMLIVCNHVTAYDGPLVQYALPGPVRRHVAAMMAGEMLEDFRHFRDPDRAPGQGRFMLLGPLAYLLVTALFNVFPLPRRRDFQRSFAHAGKALDRGYHVLVFPEGSRSAAGELAPFRPGIGILVKQSYARVLPVAIRGLGELKARGRGWFRSGKIEVRVGEALRFGPEVSVAAITERLHAEVERLLKG